MMPPKKESYWHILEEAADIAKQRGNQYGSYKENFNNIHRIYRDLFVQEGEEGVNRQDIYKIMIATKLARQSHKHNKDNLIDCINYIAMLIADGEQ